MGFIMKKYMGKRNNIPSHILLFNIKNSNTINTITTITIKT